MRYTSSIAGRAPSFRPSNPVRGSVNGSRVGSAVRAINPSLANVAYGPLELRRRVDPGAAGAVPAALRRPTHYLGRHRAPCHRGRTASAPGADEFDVVPRKLS